VEADGEVRLSVTDDGRGFVRGDHAHGFGLVGMAERVASVDGRLEIESAPGAGTTVRATLPTRIAGASATRANSAPEGSG
jgi:signal transduction histidine kinase